MVKSNDLLKKLSEQNRIKTIKELSNLKKKDISKLKIIYIS